MGVTITTRVPKEVEKQIKDISNEEKLDKSTVIRRLLVEGIREWRIERALKLYRDGKITLGKAARMADTSLRQMMKLASDRAIPFQYTAEDLQEDYEAAVR